MDYRLSRVHQVSYEDGPSETLDSGIDNMTIRVYTMLRIRHGYIIRVCRRII